MIQLDKRLRQIAALVRPGCRMVDVGTDHGYLIAWLALEERIAGGYACDIRPMPLEKARKTLRDNGLEERIECVLCDGLEKIDGTLVDDVVIAGMGGDLIANIIERAPWLKNEEKHLVLQPMTKAEHLRDHLAREGFRIEEEPAVESRQFVYSVLSVYYDGKNRKLSRLERLIGRVAESASPDTMAYLKRTEQKLLDKIEGLERSQEQKEQALQYRRLLAELQQRMEEIR